MGIVQFSYAGRGTPRRTGWAVVAPLAAAGLLLVGCMSPGAPKTAANLNGEAMYAPRAWANSEPVNISARLNAVSAAVSSLQATSDQYFANQQARADTFNAQQARKAEYESRIYHRRLEEEAAERERLRALASKNRVFKVRKLSPDDFADGPGFDFLAHDGAWGLYDLAIGNSNALSKMRGPSMPPPVLPRGRKAKPRPES